MTSRRIRSSASSKGGMILVRELASALWRNRNRLMALRRGLEGNGLAHEEEGSFYGAPIEERIPLASEEPRQPVLH